MAKIYIGWAKKLKLEMDLYISFSDQEYADSLQTTSVRTHRLIPKVLCSMPTRLRNKLGKKRFFQACLRERGIFSILHDYGRVEECQNMQNLNMNVFAVPHTMNLENYEDKYFVDSPDCGIPLLVQSKQGAGYFRQLGFHQIIECGRIDWSDISSPKIVYNQTGCELLLLPKRHLGILDSSIFARLIRKMKSGEAAVHCITHPNERLWGVVAYYFFCMLMGARMTVGGVSGLKESLPVKRVWCIYSDFVMANTNQIEKVFVRHKSKDEQLKSFLPRGLEKHEQIWFE